MFRSVLFLYLIISCFAFAGCDTIGLQPQREKFFISSSSYGDYKVDLYANEPLFVGYNRLFFKVRDTYAGQDSYEDWLTLGPLMDLGTSTHTCPFENADGHTHNGFYETAVVFTAPSDSNATWTLDVSIQKLGASSSQTVTLNIDVIDPIKPKLLAFPSQKDQKMTYVSLYKPYAPKVGLQDYWITIHKQTGPMNYLRDTLLSVFVNPQLAGSGQSSSDNEQPTHRAIGHYRGAVNFPSAGDWEVHMHLKEGLDTIANDVFFELSF